ncbi:MAG: adenosylmethionine--8-amino-7-oxononanoate transaminase [Bacteroidota bacterium]|nr:adenosylmethionine--8-amino-7-oxononanoate transaminase [Bacteroidota bacterium]
MTLSERDRNLIWHPYTQMLLEPESIGIVRGEKEFLYDEQGKRYIDAIASWWVNIHGHSHPYIAEKVHEQMNKLEQVIFAGFTHSPAVELAERLLKLLPEKQKKVFFSDNGSTAVEVAIKMALQFYANQGVKRNTIVSFTNAYHGDTFGAMSVSGRSIFTKPFNQYLFDVKFIEPPTAGNEEKSLRQLEEIIQKHRVAAFIFEPLIQGSSGMLMHTPEGLNRLLRLCHCCSVLTIGDEVMTGFGRTGKMWATDYLDEKPDIYCLSKGLTGGVMPLGVTTCTQSIYDKFLSPDKHKTLYHGHSFTANPIACTVALASLDLFEKENTMEKVKRIEKRHAEFAKELKNNKKIKDIRHRGVIIAIELQEDCEETSYINPMRDKIYNFFISRGIILRPLGNIIYMNPPYCISEESLDYIYDNITQFINN